MPIIVDMAQEVIPSAILVENMDTSVETAIRIWTINFEASISMILRGRGAVIAAMKDPDQEAEAIL